MIRFDYAGADLNDPLAFDALVSQMVDSSDPDHVRHQARVFVARHLWEQSGFRSDAAKARLDSEMQTYRACWRVDSCARGLCHTTYECKCDDLGVTVPQARADTLGAPINQAPFTFAADDPGYEKALRILGSERCRELREECEHDILEHPAMRRGQELAGAYNKILRAAIVAVYPDLADKAVVESTDWLWRQFQVLSVPDSRSDARDTVFRTDLQRTMPKTQMSEKIEATIEKFRASNANAAADRAAARAEREARAQERAAGRASSATTTPSPSPIVQERTDSQPQESHMRSYETILKQTGGNAQEARRIFNQETFDSPRPALASVRSDSVDPDEARRFMVLRNRTAWLGSPGATTEVASDSQRRAAAFRERQKRMDANDAEMRKAREERFRADAIPTSAKCSECGKELDAEDVEAGIHPECATEVARQDMKTRNAARSRASFGLAAKMRGYNPDDAA